MRYPLCLHCLTNDNTVKSSLSTTCYQFNGKKNACKRRSIIRLRAPMEGTRDLGYLNILLVNVFTHCHIDLPVCRAKVARCFQRIFQRGEALERDVDRLNKQTDL